MTVEGGYRIREIKHTLEKDRMTTYLNYQNKRAQNPLRVKERGTQQSKALDHPNYYWYPPIPVILPSQPTTF